MTTSLSRACVLALALIACPSSVLRSQPTAATLHPTLLSRPIAVVVEPSSQIMHVGNQDSGTITTIDLTTKASRESQSFGHKLKDLFWNATTKTLIAVIESPNQLISLRSKEGTLTIVQQTPLAIVPERAATSTDGTFVCITDRWNSSSQFGMASPDPAVGFQIGTTLALPFLPKEVHSVSDHRFVIADAFGGNLAVVDSVQGSLIGAYRFSGHHIGGMGVDPVRKTLLVTHQIMNATAHTSQADIHWGTLMSNVVRCIPLDALVEREELLDSKSTLQNLGSMGSGEADPSGVVAWEDRLVVAASGTNHLVLRSQTTDTKQVVELPAYPNRLAWVGNSKLAVVSTLSNSVSIVSLPSLSIESIYGSESPSPTQELAGEIAFHDASLSHDGWISCNSCHIDGHTSNLLADTLGDRTYSSPKRIPSLLSNFNTAPYGWIGNKKTMEDQLEQTLANTMHTERPIQEKKKLTANLITYLKTLRLPPLKPTQDEPIQGLRLFESRGCSNCHQPDQEFTTANVYDLGVQDENGWKEFNPPTLNGLRFRKAFFHDARFSSLDVLLNNHPEPKPQWPAGDLEALREWLLQL